MHDIPILIVGGGAAGLSAAGALKRRGMRAVVVDKLPGVGAIWARRYDRLRLHTVYSGIAHLPMRGYPPYPSKDEYAAYLRDYARRFELDVVTGCAVRKVRMCEGEARPAWQVESDCGIWRARVVVIGAGQYGVPITPAWPGLETYRGELAHSSSYKNARPYAGKRVLVVGIGNSGAEIAADLAEGGAAFVAISVRTPPPIVARDLFGLLAVQRSSLLLTLLPPKLADIFVRGITRLAVGDLTRYGLPKAAWWPYTTQSVPVIDTGFVGAVKRGAVHIRPNIERFTPGGVVFVDGRAEQYDAVIAATGFRTGLDQILDAPGALDQNGEPAFGSGEPTSFPGLYFVGYGHSLRGHLFETNRAAQRLARAIERYLGVEAIK
jgi:cation diffusion facilitator CzcD-associated flavoprotein CzcO